MKLLAQFYACLAIIVFIAVIGGIEARSTVGGSSFMTAGNRRDLFAAHGSEDEGEKHISSDEHLRERREATSTSFKDQEQQAHEDEEKKAPRSRRHIPKEDEMPKKPESGAEEPSEGHKHRSRRQMPEGPSDPKDMMNKFPQPGRK